MTIMNQCGRVVPVNIAVVRLYKLASIIIRVIINIFRLRLCYVFAAQCGDGLFWRHFIRMAYNKNTAGAKQVFYCK